MNDKESMIVNRLRELTEDGNVDWKAEGLSFPGYVDFKSKIGPPLLIIEVRSGGPITSEDSNYNHWLAIHQSEEGIDESGTRLPDTCLIIEPSKGTDMLVEEISRSTFNLPDGTEDNDPEKLDKVLEIFKNRFPL